MEQKEKVMNETESSGKQFGDKLTTKYLRGRKSERICPQE